MEPFKTCGTLIMAFFIQLSYVTFCQFYSITSPVLFTKITNYGMREKKILLYMYGCVSVLCYINGDKKFYL